MQRALDFWGSPSVSDDVRGSLAQFARDALATADKRWKKTSYPVLAENALRLLVAASPALQTS